MGEMASLLTMERLHRAWRPSEVPRRSARKAGEVPRARGRRRVESGPGPVLTAQARQRLGAELPALIAGLRPALRAGQIERLVVWPWS